MGTVSERTAGGERLRAVASYGSYEKAEAAVDALADQGLPVAGVTIVGRDLRLVEEVIGRRTLPRAAVDAAITGAVLGVLLGWLLGVLGIVEPLVSAALLGVYGASLGLAAGAMVGLAVHLWIGGRHDFDSSRRMEAARYELLIDEDRVEDAQALLGDHDIRRGA